jgi:hypothetical protein
MTCDIVVTSDTASAGSILAMAPRIGPTIAEVSPSVMAATLIRRKKPEIGAVGAA